MDAIVKQLDEIESAAVSIVKNAEAQKAALAQEYQQKRIDFDESLEAEIQKTIRQIRSATEQEAQSKSGRDAQKKSPAAELEECYAANHTRWAKEIFARITEV
ncbi:MAG: hypothetical protein SOY12_08810 [Schaedlerella sp.]|nr:hypothetical protein [Lachnospiraceae bacterium]MDY4203115.1 hypothetical protein [Schaedlerella sp.]